MSFNSIFADDLYFLIDDFSGDKFRLNRSWEGFTDQVMGGVSEISISRISRQNEPFVRMSGEVSLENNGGFIQIRHMLSEPFKPFDGSDYQGIRLKVRGRGDGYYIFLRTTATVFPWKFYKSEIMLEETWSTVDLPWSSFSEGDYGTLRAFRPDKLKSLAIVAYGKEFTAQIDISEIGLYK
ncbi:CIA30 family protein [Spirochaeta isovalerica]|uniref:NADH:ubiquinone oxidoreductase intermediate-associated protein 30 domain-containing protein n=1 Tax=Spirochaeta isovalerica TaxID=150 RepID=A0A841RCI9_9SPIO|nr:CIA30 family protein [Spirochaeta isovalerica]MBB6481386.1 hypothetical protein [Spirochaeta isovalerica]